MDSEPCHQAATDNHQPSNLKWPQTEQPTTNCCSGDASFNDSNQEASLSMSLPTKADELTNSQAKIHEESTKKALLLKRKELKWKLMRASQAQNQAKLMEIKTALNYHKQKLSKAQALAAKLRAKYVKVVRSAKLTEAQYKTAEAQLALQEKYVADEKMQLTKLALECIKIGQSLYDSNYKLPENNNQLNSHKTKYSGLKTSNQMNKQPSDKQTKPLDDTTQVTKEEILKKLTPFLRQARAMAGGNNDNPVKTNQPHNEVIDCVTANVIHPNLTMRKRKRNFVSRLSSLYDLNDSILKNLASYRLTQYVCLPDLLGECSDKSCLYQHKSNYFMTDLEKLTDILSYRPAAAGWIREDTDLDEAENYRVCRVKLKQYAAKLISRNAEKPVEMIARAIVANDIRNDEADIDLLLKRRQLPKTVHLNKPLPIECPCRIVVTPSPENTGDTVVTTKDQMVKMDTNLDKA